MIRIRFPLHIPLDIRETWIDQLFTGISAHRMVPSCIWLPSLEEAHLAMFLPHHPHRDVKLHVLSRQDVELHSLQNLDCLILALRTVASTALTNNHHVQQRVSPQTSLEFLLALMKSLLCRFFDVSRIHPRRPRYQRNFTASPSQAYTLIHTIGLLQYPSGFWIFFATAYARE